MNKDEVKEDLFKLLQIDITDKKLKQLISSIHCYTCFDSGITGFHGFKECSCNFTDSNFYNYSKHIYIEIMENKSLALNKPSYLSVIVLFLI